MQIFQSVVVTLLLYMIHLCDAKSYSNYSIYNVYARSEGDYRLLESFERNTNMKVIFVESPQESQVVQILVHHNSETDFLAKMNHFKVRIRKIAENAQKVFDDQLDHFDDQLDQETQFRATNKQCIKSLNRVGCWLNITAKKYDSASLVSIGKSAEGREIYAIAIKSPIRPNYHYSKAIIEAGLHGNEWQSTSSTMYMIEQVLNATEGPYALLKKKYFLYFIPIANPDGYAYSQKTDRLWKKNRRKTGENTYGVNLNRNFDYKWGEFDSSDDPQSQYYQGPYPFSEPETQHLRDYIMSKGNQIAFYFSVHGHGQKFILPYADSTKHIVNYHEVHDHAKSAITKMISMRSLRDSNNRPYQIGLANEVLGKRYSGDSASWVKKSYHVPYTVTLQLRDEGDLGIASPRSMLPYTSQEMAEGLTKFMINTHYYRSYETEPNKTAERIEPLLYMYLAVCFMLILN